jgi:hypothetical protein
MQGVYDTGRVAAASAASTVQGLAYRAANAMGDEMRDRGLRAGRSSLGVGAESALAMARSAQGRRFQRNLKGAGIGILMTQF